MGPRPIAAKNLAELGANVLTIRRPGGGGRGRNNVLERARAGTLELNVKDADDKARLLALMAQADVLLEGFRPEVMERLGLGPDVCQGRNPRLIYGRVTGWGRVGPLAMSAGHDLNYIALSGALYGMGTRESGPVPPLNLVGDYGGGGLMLAMGIMAALYERAQSGVGQIVDAAMTGGSAMLMAALYGRLPKQQWSAERAVNLLDGSAYYYRCYACRDGGWMSVGAIELPFRTILLEKLGLADQAGDILQQADTAPAIHELLQQTFMGKTRDEWAAIFFGTDACVAPVLAMDEVMAHPQNIACATFQDIDGCLHPTPVPQFSRTGIATIKATAEDPALLAQWGL
jgi:alpha-methylacyl-CoA racemase